MLDVLTLAAVIILAPALGTAVFAELVRRFDGVKPWH